MNDTPFCPFKAALREVHKGKTFHLLDPRQPPPDARNRFCLSLQALKGWSDPWEWWDLRSLRRVSFPPISPSSQ